MIKKSEAMVIMEVRVQVSADCLIKLFEHIHY
jgi:hypothetical protein